MPHRDRAHPPVGWLQHGDFAESAPPAGFTGHVHQHLDRRGELTVQGTAIQAADQLMANVDADGELPRGETLRHLSIVGTAFEARVVEEVEGGVVTEVAGSASLTGRHEFVLEDDDELGEGFLLR